SLIGIYQKTHGEQLHAVFFERDQLSLRVDIGPFAIQAEHGGHGGAVDIGVDQSHGCSGFGQCDGQIGGNGRFAHTAFSRGYGDNVPDPGQQVVCTGLLSAPGDVRVHVDGRHGVLVDQLPDRV